MSFRWKTDEPQPFDEAAPLCAWSDEIAPLPPHLKHSPPKADAVLAAMAHEPEPAPAPAPAARARPSSVEALLAERDGLFDELRVEMRTLGGEEARLAAALCAAAGCGPAVLGEVDALYAEADAAHRAALAALDARFAPVRAARDAWVAAQLDGHASDVAKARSLRSAADTIPAGLVDASVAEDLRGRADALDAARKLSEATMALWFDAGLRVTQPSHLADLPFTPSSPTPAPARPIALGVEHLRGEHLRARVLALVAASRKPEPQTFSLGGAGRRA